MVPLRNNLHVLISSKVYIFSPIHQLHYEAALRIYSDYKIFGAGPKLFRQLCKKEKYVLMKGNVILPSCSTHPHNTYIQALSETGLIGFFFLISIFFILSFRLFKHFINIFIYRNYLLSDYEVCLLIAMLLSLWPLAPSGNFYNNWMSIVYFLPVGFFLQNLYKLNDK